MLTKDGQPDLPTNMNMALCHLNILWKELKKDNKYESQYQAFMKNIKSNHNMEMVPAAEVQIDNGRVWALS